MADDKNDVIKNPDPFIVKITDLDGGVHELTAKVVSPKNLKDYEAVYGNKILKAPYEEQLIIQMAWTFDKEKEFFMNFDIKVLKKAIAKFASSVENPI